MKKLLENDNMTSTTKASSSPSSRLELHLLGQRKNSNNNINKKASFSDVTSIASTSEVASLAGTEVTEITTCSNTTTTTTNNYERTGSTTTDDDNTTVKDSSANQTITTPTVRTNEGPILGATPLSSSTIISDRPPPCQIQVGVRIRPYTSRNNDDGINDNSCATFLNCRTDANTIEVIGNTTTATDAQDSSSSHGTRTIKNTTMNGTKATNNPVKRKFIYDAVFDENTSQIQIYQSIAPPLLHTVLQGYNATIIAYGQTGSGKTYTMGSSSSSNINAATNITNDSGIIPRFMFDLFDKLSSTESSTNGSSGTAPSFKVSASFLEVYGEDIYDLLVTLAPISNNSDRCTTAMTTPSPKINRKQPQQQQTSLRLREEKDGKVVCMGLTEHPIQNVSDTMRLLQIGTQNRTVAATAMNATSSRSHAILTISIQQTKRISCETDSATPDDNGTTKTIASQITFVDLAGSERITKTGCVGQRAKEGIQINQGLLALGNVIHALASKEDDANINKNKSRSTTPVRRRIAPTTSGNSTDKKISPKRPQQPMQPQFHIPYRDSKLTRLLQDALGGNSQTYFIACVSGMEENEHETISTLQYANRARNIQNAPKQNTCNTPATITKEELEKLQKYNAILQAEVVKYKFFGNTSCTNSMNDTESTVNTDVSVRKSTIQKYLQQLQDLVDSSEDTKKNNTPVDKANRRTSFQLSKILSFRNNVTTPPSTPAAIENVTHNQQNQLTLLEGELAIQESELERLRHNASKYESMKEQLDTLTETVRKLEEEKSKLSEELSRVSSNLDYDSNDTFLQTITVQQKIETVDHNLARARTDALKQRLACRTAEQDGVKCTMLEQQITNLKQSHNKMVQQQKGDRIKYQTALHEKNREINALRRKDKMAEKSTNKLNADIVGYKRNLDRRQDICMKLICDLKEAEATITCLLSKQKQSTNNCSNKENRTVRRNLPENPVTPHKVNAEVHKDDISASNPDESYNDDDSSSSDCFAPNADELQDLQLLLENAVRQKIQYIQIKDKFEEQCQKYSDALKSLDSTVEHLEQMKEASLSKMAALGGAENTVDQDNIDYKTLIEELETMIDEYQTELSMYDKELEQLESKLQTFKDRDQQENSSIRKLIKNKNAPLVRTLFLDVIDMLAESELHRNQLENIVRETENKALESEDAIAALKERISGLEKEIHHRSVIIQKLEEMESIADDEEENEQSQWKIWIWRLLMGKGSDSYYFYNGMLQLYFLITISVVFQGNHFFPPRLQPILHLLCGIAGFIAASKEYIWIISDERSNDELNSSCTLQTLCFFVDLLIHIMM